jgi:hypothetical protein
MSSRIEKRAQAAELRAEPLVARLEVLNPAGRKDKQNMRNNTNGLQPSKLSKRQSNKLILVFLF